MLSRPIGIYGGTFDPVHIGHLRIAIELFEQFKFDHIRFIPSKIPVHRPPTFATTQQRLEMLKLALAPHQNFILDMKEIERETPSYTYLTLQRLKEEFPESPLCLILGIDAFLKFDTWYEWEKILETSHIILIERPFTFFNQLYENKKIEALIKLRRTIQKNHLHEKNSGCIYLASVPLLAISSTELREKFKAQISTQYLLTPEVQEYIFKYDVYRA